MYSFLSAWILDTHGTCHRGKLQNVDASGHFYQINTFEGMSDVWRSVGGKEATVRLSEMRSVPATTSSMLAINHDISIFENSLNHQAALPQNYATPGLDQRQDDNERQHH